MTDPIREVSHSGAVRPSDSTSVRTPPSGQLGAREVVPFTVAECPQEKIPELIALTQKWQKDVRLLPQTERVRDACGFYRDIERYLKKEGYRALVCSAKGAVQAVAIYHRTDPAYITLLVTAPHNLNHNSPIRVAGAGSALVAQFERVALRVTKDVELTSLPGALSFYERHQFEVIRIEEIPPRFHMKLSIDKIRALGQRLPGVGGEENHSH